MLFLQAGKMSCPAWSRSQARTGCEGEVPFDNEETVVEDTSLMQAWRTETYTKWLAGLLTAGQVVDLLGATASPACDP